MSIAVSWTTFAKITCYEEIDFIDKKIDNQRSTRLYFFG